MRILVPSDQQMSDSKTVMFFLTLSGGLQDAYTYWMREEVFANAQTGNIVLMTGYLFHKEWTEAFRYLVPLIAFACGVLAAEQLRGRFQQMQALHWRQVIVVIEALLLFVSGQLPVSLNHFANAIISFSCAMQVESFRKVNGCSYASTMCIGNLRSGMDALSVWLRTRDVTMLRKAGQYFHVILCFALGSGLGTVLSARFGLRTIWISSVLLTAAFFLMFRQKKSTAG
jgi:uncharacterized membrane protein YoaK (UPF0700 family)